jgi:hypothetical protein
MKLICILAVTATLAQAQQLPKVDPPKGVDVNVAGITWHPQGMGLLYTKPEGTGTGIGIYALGQPEGEVVVHLRQNDRYEAQWFDNQTVATIIVYRDLVSDGEKYMEASVYLADAMKGQSQLLWSQAYSAKSGGIDLDVDVSPRLRHAIYRVKNGKNRYHLVLPIGGTRLIPSPDLDKAQRDGLSGPSWSLDGTAIFALQPGGAQKFEISSDKISTTNVGDSNGVKTVAGTLALETFTVELVGAVSDASFKFADGNLALWIAKPPPPPVGATVLELMPANASLRQVRFKGPWQDRALPQNDLRAITRPSNIQFGSTAAAADSLWLVSGKEPRDGILLAAHAEKSWIGPGSAAVAYLTDGALFVRLLIKPGQ